MGSTVPSAEAGQSRPAVIRQVTRLLRSASAEQRSLLLCVQGDAGHGKSEVLAKVSEQLIRQDVTVLAMSGSSVTAGMPYAGILDLLLDDAPHPSTPGLIDELSSFRSEPSPLAVATGVKNWLRERSGGRPLTVLVDDADLVDDDSLRVLAYTAVRDSSTAVSVLHSATGPVPLFDRLLVQQFALDDLGQDDGVEVAIEAGADERRAIALFDALGGNPLALVHGGANPPSRDPRGHPPVAARLVFDIQRRLVDRAPAVVRMLEGSAVTGVARLRQLAAMSPPVEGGFQQCAEEIEGTGIAVIDGDDVRWRRRWMRAAVLENCPESRRSRWEALAKSGHGFAAGSSPDRDSASMNPSAKATWEAVSLTAAERRTVEVVVAGLSTREAARSLHVSEKTIESHLQSVYRKLNVHSRVQLALAVARGGVPSTRFTEP